MKRFGKYMMMLALLATSFALTSCDVEWYEDDYDYWYGANRPWWYSYSNCDDYYWHNNWYSDNSWGYADQGNTALDMAQVLAGEWQGVMQFTNGDTGEKSQFYVDMIFAQNKWNAIKGTGVEIDSDDNGASQTLNFNWYIDEKTGDLYVKYASGSTYVMDASASNHGFYLDERKGTFDGYMMGTNNNDLIYITLDRVTANAKSMSRAATTQARSFGSTSVEKPATAGATRIVKH